MQSKWMRRLGVTSLIGAMAYASVGCAEEREPRDYVQPNALEKSFFVGAKLRDSSDDPEFYMRNTVVDVPYGAGIDGLFTATYAQPVNRIKWEITEDELIARMTHERITDSDHKGSRRTNDGTVVAVFRILTHFDVKRAYNPGTGEDLNIIEENMSDRPWYDRQYMRVDWSQNLVTDGYAVDTLSSLGIFGVKYSPIAFKVEDPNDPNRPVFAPSEGYFDVTQKVWASPDMVDTPWGKYPSCWFGGALGTVTTNCSPTEATLRLSFRKVTDTDYEPVEWNGNKMDAFGVFLEERFGYDRNFGLVDQNWHRFAALHNIWEKSHIEGSQCAVDYWRDADGNIAKYKQNADGSFAKDAKTGLPIPDAKGAPYAGTPVGKDYHRDVNGSTPDDGKGTEDDCEFTDGAGNLLHKGAYCDVATKKCALPRYERKFKTRAWYYGPEATSDLFPSSAKALENWNIAVKTAALIGMKAEAERVGATINPAIFGTDAGKVQAILDDLDEDTVRTDKNDAIAAKIKPAIPDLFVLCHSPTVSSDPDVCFAGENKDGKKRTVYARVGDIRYHSVNIIDHPQANGLLGIMVDAVDPLTGEKIASSVNNWAGSLDMFTQGQVDLLRWVSGEISDEQIANGKYLRDWVDASKLGAAPHMGRTLSREEIELRTSSVDNTLRSMNGLTPEDRNLPEPLRRQKAHEHLARTLGPSVTPDLNALRQKIIGSRWESAMVTPEMLQFAGLPPNSAIAEEQTLNMASPFRGGMSPDFRAWVERKKAIGLAANHACMIEQPEPNGIVGLARLALKEFPAPDPNKAGECPYDASIDQKADYPACKRRRDTKVFQWLRDQFNFAVMSHEMGHSMALRHNFTGSADPFNFHQEYWQLRTRLGEEKACTDGLTPHTDGKECVGPRWVDPVTEEEVDGIIWRYGLTTVMDYPGDPTGDTMPIGAYDKAAMRFIYGNVADVEEDAVVGTDKGDAFIGALDGPNYYGNTIGDVHYSKLNDIYKMVDKSRCKPIVANPKSPVDYKCERYSKEPGHRLIHPSLRDMKAQPKYGEEVLKLRPDLVANFAVYELPDAKNPKQPKLLARHPYVFMSDEYADTSNVGVYRHDAGADPYEMMQFLITTYENRYIFDNFRRDRVTFTPRSAAMRTMGRYFDKIHGMAKAYFLRAESSDAGDDKNPDKLQAMALATSDAFDLFIRAMTRPEPGSYRIDRSGSIPVARAMTAGEVKENVQSDFAVAAGSGEGRFVNNDYDYSQGEHWYQYPTVAGNWFEKIVAIYYLLEAENNYVSNQKEDYIDGRYKNTNFANVYPEQMRRLLAQLFQGDMTTLGPYTGGPTGTLAANKVSRVQYLPWYAWDTKQPTTTAIAYPKDAVVLNPLFGWNQQMYGIINTFIYGTTKLTMDTAAQMRIFSTGDQSTVSLEPGQTIRYQDPFSSITYVARDYGEELVSTQVVKKTPGARMLQFANQLAQATFEVSSVDATTGEATYVKDAQGNPVCKAGVDCATNSAKVRAYSSNIDTVRQLGQWFYGPL